MRIELRPARREEIGLLQEIEQVADERFAAAGHPELTDGAVMPEEVAARAIDEGRLTVAEADGTVVGFVVRAALGGEACVAQLSVTPAVGRRGVGTALLDHVIEAARVGGHGSLVLVTQSDVPWNQAWYERRGFVVVPEAEWTPAMHAAMEAQVAAGLDRATRVQMRLPLRGDGS
jgi:ribosomal protein S18 acetylase RimI-like enzyme